MLTNSSFVLIHLHANLVRFCASCQRIYFPQVLDEADRLLESSYEEDLEVIFEALPQERQTLLFSATLTDTLSRLREVAHNQPFYWEAPTE